MNSENSKNNEPEIIEQTVVEVAEAAASAANQSAEKNSQDQKILTLEETNKQLQDKIVRSYAELENARKRAQIDVAQAKTRGAQYVVEDLLAVADSLEMALQSSKQQLEQQQLADTVVDVQKNMLQGIELTLKMLLDVLAKHGVQVIAALDQPFDPNKHEAMSMVPSSPEQVNRVLQVYQTGYELAGRVIRPARVAVGKG